MNIGTGWLGWTQQQTDNTDLDVIVNAYKTRVEMLRFMSGRPIAPTPTTPPSGTPLTPALFMAIFGKKE